jgi:Holliday junction resolvase
MGMHSRAKGKRGERDLVALARQHGLAAERTWHLAQSPDPQERCCDVRIEGKAY